MGAPRGAQTQSNTPAPSGQGGSEGPHGKAWNEKGHRGRPDGQHAMWARRRRPHSRRGTDRGTRREGVTAAGLRRGCSLSRTGTDRRGSTGSPIGRRRSGAAAGLTAAQQLPPYAQRIPCWRKLGCRECCSTVSGSGGSGRGSRADRSGYGSSVGHGLRRGWECRGWVSGCRCRHEGEVLQVLADVVGAGGGRPPVWGAGAVIGSSTTRVWAAYVLHRNDERDPDRHHHGQTVSAASKHATQTNQNGPGQTTAHTGYMQKPQTTSHAYRQPQCTSHCVHKPPVTDVCL